jgi:YggT family protein
MSLIGSLLGYVFTAFLLLLVARMVLDWVGVLAGTPRWTGGARRLTHTLTEPVVAPVRRRLRPIRTSGVSIDVAFTVVFVVVLILRTIAFSL